MEKSIARRCIVSGQVQGVFFRGATQQRARMLGIHGWVRNLPNGDVEVYACGNAARVDALTAWLWHGPPRAQVIDVTVTNAPLAPFTEFTVLR